MGGIEELNNLVMKDFCPYTAGGDSIKNIRVGSFEQRHYEQDDKSLNTALWDMYPVDAPLVDLDPELSMTTDVRQPKYHLLDQPWEAGKLLPPYALADIDASIVDFEKMRVAKNLLSVNRAFLATTTGFTHYHSSLKGVGPVSARLAQNKKGAKTKALPELIAALGAKKDAANKLFIAKKYLPGMKEYVKILIELYPWSATPLIFTSADAFSTGIAQLESSVWSNMAGTALNLAKKDKNWYIVAMDASWAVITMRYVASKLLCKGYDREWWSGAITGWGVVPKSTTDAMELAELAKKVEAVGAKHGNNTWAHKMCVDEHKGCCEVGEADAVSALGEKIQNTL
ncbi:uncharacterized protein LOC62_06G008609 [Vanrija pseudolonga]|uniref:Uncharacterized protein n=1 Tax=Vanrija pseudolonga TaxID=143232 RepID=A0AAF0YGE4_9TREE|nr:hypothetical protein LOC62_06G008609 [Vanrija pseudolonga]